MSNKVLLVILSFIALVISVLLFPDGPAAVFVGIVTAGLAFAVFSKDHENKDFLLKVFLIGLILRTVMGAIISVFSLHEFFGPDATYYDWLGYVLSSYWVGDLPANYPDLTKIRDTSQSGWGMSYIVGTIYFFTGRNLLAAQFFCAVVGAATAPVIYLCAKEIFSNKRVAQISGYIVALSPSLIIWSSQALKDGLIVFFLVLAILTVIQLQKRFNYLPFALLMLSLFGIVSLRFYIFYLLIFAIVGCFVIGTTLNPVSVLRRTIVLLVLGVSLSLAGATNEEDLEKFNLNRVEQTRRDLARGNAGYGKDQDVSTTGGALTALPTGFTYLMLAPFPWQMTNLRQAITLPEMILWWASIPFLIMGLIYTVRHRLRSSIAVLLFTLMLTAAYSLYQGNIGTAYRQRAQIQIFHFMFIAAGATLWLEKRENKQLERNLRRQTGLRNLQYKGNV